MAFRDAAMKAKPVLLEPVMGVEVRVSPEHVDDVAGNLTSRRGQIQSQDVRAGMQVIKARVPLSEMFGYWTDLRERTRGRGTFAMQLDHYQRCPPADDDNGSRDSLVGSPRKAPHPLRDSGVALPEPDEDGPGD
jgi:elongation factor G